MAVPAHDERDWAFAQQYALSIREVISGGNVQEAAFTDTDRRKVVNSSMGDGTFSLNGLTSSEAILKVTEWLAKQGKGTRAVNYKLRDWLFARQRYWGEPFPIMWVDGEVHARFRKSNFPSCCRNPTTLNRPAQERVRWRTWTSGSSPPIPPPTNRLGARPTPCRSGPGLAGTICDSSTPKIQHSSLTLKKSAIGCP